MDSRKACPSQFIKDVEVRRRRVLECVECIPISALIWGPAPIAGTSVANTRLRLKEALTLDGHLADFSEDLVDDALPNSLIMQQCSHVEAYDVVFSIPDSPGSIAEIHSFARIPHISSNIVAFLDESWNSGFSNQALIQLESIATCKVELYDSMNLPDCVIAPALSQVRRLQEFYYLGGRRY